MIDKDFCMSSYLAFRYIIDDQKDFTEGVTHRTYRLIPDKDRVMVADEHDIDKALEKQISAVRDKRLGILLSGGMDSACLVSYMPGCDAYTFRFLGGTYQTEELKRAEYYANKYNMHLHYVDIDWSTVEDNLKDVMIHKGAPVHSIEPQILAAAKQAKADCIDMMIIGDAADYVFGGMDGLHEKDWGYEEFKRRYIYVNPDEVLKHPADINYAFAKYQRGEKIDFIALMHEYTDIESYSSYENAFSTANMPFLDPYEALKMSEPLDLNRIRNGESKYLVRSLFRLKYPECEIPEKRPMPRPVDEYFATWEGPIRNEFVENLDMRAFSGNQKWLLWCLEQYLELIENQNRFQK